jgi:hypothetical protein
VGWACRVCGVGTHDPPNLSFLSSQLSALCPVRHCLLRKMFMSDAHLWVTTVRRQDFDGIMVLAFRAADTPGSLTDFVA